MDELNHSQENRAEACSRLRLEMQIDRFDQFVTLNDSSSVQLFLYLITIRSGLRSLLRNWVRIVRCETRDN